MKKVFFMLVLSYCLWKAFLAPSYAVNYLDGHHCPEGYYLALYPSWYSSDKITDNHGNNADDNFGLDLSMLLLRPTLYTENFVINAIIPVGYKSIDSLNDRDSGIGDIIVGGGYFLPIMWADIVPVLQIKMPAGSFDEDDLVNLGNGQYDIQTEIYLFKSIDKFSFDFALKYWFRFENHDTDLKPGNEVHAEALVTYGLSEKFRLGPSFSFTKSADQEMNGHKQRDTALKKLSMGCEFVYQASNAQYLLDVIVDMESENYTKGLLISGRICIPF